MPNSLEVSSTFCLNLLVPAASKDHLTVLSAFWSYLMWAFLNSDCVSSVFLIVQDKNSLGLPEARIVLLLDPGAFY